MNLPNGRKPMNSIVMAWPAKRPLTTLSRPPLTASPLAFPVAERGLGLRVDGANQALLVFPSGDSDIARVAIQHAEGGVSHDIQLNHPRLEFSAHRTYSIRFRQMLRAALDSVSPMQSPI